MILSKSGTDMSGSFHVFMKQKEGVRIKTTDAATSQQLSSKTIYSSGKTAQGSVKLNGFIFDFDYEVEVEYE